MRTRWALVTALGLAATAAAQGHADGGTPPGWFYAGPTSYEQGRGPVACGGTGAWLRSTGSDAGLAERPGTVMQLFRADRFRGQRLRFSGVSSTRDVVGSAALWLRVDAANKRTVAFDNMKDRTLKGTTSCRRHSLVVDVPPEAEYVALGFVLEGSGVIELSDVDIEIVDHTVPVTDLLPAVADHSPLPSHSSDAGTAARSFIEHPNGRVGGMWFTDDTMGVYGTASGLNRHGDKWVGQFTAEMTPDGGIAVEQHAPAYRGSFSLRHEGDTTIIEGTWGTSLKSFPVSIRYNHKTVDMTWGFYERHLKQEDAPQLPETCVYYSQRQGLSTSDRLELCGTVLLDQPDVVQTVTAFLWEGFRRQAQKPW